MDMCIYVYIHISIYQWIYGSQAKRSFFCGVTWLSQEASIFVFAFKMYHVHIMYVQSMTYMYTYIFKEYAQKGCTIHCTLHKVEATSPERDAKDIQLRLEGVLCRFFSHKKCVCLRYYSLLHRPLYIRFFTSFLILCIPDLRWLTLMMIVYHHLHNISQIYMLHYVHLKMQSDSRKARGTAAEKGMRRVTAERPVA